MRPETAVVLAAGKGTRMRRPDLPKPLVPVGGQPMLDRVLDGLDGAGFRRCVLVVGHLHDLVRDRYGDRHGHLDIAYALQVSQEGTAHAVTCAAPLVAGEEAVLLTWADILVAPALYEMLATAWDVRPGLAALTTVLQGDPSVGALVEFGRDLRMTAFTEKPVGVTRGWADGGVSILSDEAVDVMAGVLPSPRGERELADGLRALLAAGRPVGVERYTGPWADLASPELVAAAEDRFAEILEGGV